MRKRHIPMGIDIPANCKPFIAWLSSGRTWERNSPTIIHKKTQTTKYFSKKLRFFFFGAMGSSSIGHLFCFCLATYVAQVGDWQHSLFGIPNGHLRSFVIVFGHFLC